MMKYVKMLGVSCQFMSFFRQRATVKGILPPPLPTASLSATQGSI